MERVLQLIAEYQWWIYLVLGLLLLFYLRRAIMARREGSRSIFKLEQEQARARYGRSVIAMLIIVLVMVAIFAVANYPMLAELREPPPEPTSTPTTGPLAAPTLTATPPPPTITPTATATQVRPTRPVRPSATPEVVETVAPVVSAPSCPNPGVRITSPGVNQVVQGNVSVVGSADVPDFGYYKVEVGRGANPQQQHEWTVVGQLHESRVSGGLLETFNSDAYPPGVYTLRLVVVDATGNFPEPCRVTVTVQR
jgi:hypothetical protein